MSTRLVQIPQSAEVADQVRPGRFQARGTYPVSTTDDIVQLAHHFDQILATIPTTEDGGQMAGSLADAIRGWAANQAFTVVLTFGN